MASLTCFSFRARTYAQMKAYGHNNKFANITGFSAAGTENVYSFVYIYGREQHVRVNTISQSPTMTTAGSGVKGMDKLFDFANRMSCLLYTSVLLRIPNLWVL